MTACSPSSRARLAFALGLLLLIHTSHAQDGPALGTPVPHAPSVSSPWQAELRALAQHLLELRDASTGLELSAQRLTSTSENVVIDALRIPITDEATLFAQRTELTADHVVFDDLTLSSPTLEARATTLRWAKDATELTASGAQITLRRPGHTLSLSAEHLHFSPITGALHLEGARFSPCGCDHDTHLAFEAASLHVILDDPERPILLDEVALSLGELPITLAVDAIERDGRATGFLLPELGYTSALGFLLRAPIFIRLGEHADLTLTPGWTTAQGPTLDARVRYAWSPDTEGQMALESRYDVFRNEAFVGTRGRLRARWVEALSLLLDVDMLSDLSLHDAQRRTLHERARRYGRNRLVVGWDVDTQHLILGAEWLQTRPRRHQAVLNGLNAFDPIPLGAPSLQRLPWLRYGLHTPLIHDLSFDLDARYAYVHPLRGGSWLDLGPSFERGPLGLLEARVGDGTGDGARTLDEILTRTHALSLAAGLRYATHLWDALTLSLGGGVEHRQSLAERQDTGATAVRHATALGLEAQLSTALSRVDDDVVHSLEPSLRWTSRLWALESDALDGQPPFEHDFGERFSHQLETRLSSTWTAPSWSLDTHLTHVLFPTESFSDGTGAGVLWSGLGWRDERVALNVAMGLDMAALESPWWNASAELRGGLWRAWIAHHHRGASKTLAQRPSGLLPALTWRSLTETLSPLVGTPSSELGLSWMGSPIALAAQGILLHGRGEALRGWEVGAAVDYVAPCGCWRAGARFARHASSPTWDVGLRFELLNRP